jgi:hypothetical protein
MNVNQQILLMWEQGATSGQIAAHFGLTRSTIMGRVQRAQNKGDAHVRAPLKKKRSKNKLKVNVKPIQGIKIIQDKTDYKEIVTLEEFAQRENRSDGPKTLLELGKYDCRWMIDEKTYCGNETTYGHSWCPQHKGLVFSASNNDADKPTNAS